jgi:hypothetical protein
MTDRDAKHPTGPLPRAASGKLKLGAPVAGRSPHDDKPPEPTIDQLFEIISELSGWERQDLVVELQPINPTGYAARTSLCGVFTGGGRPHYVCVTGDSVLLALFALAGELDRAIGVLSGSAQTRRHLTHQAWTRFAERYK